MAYRPTNAPRPGLPRVLEPIDDDVANVARTALGRPQADVREWWLDDVAYQVASPTTAGLFRVRGVAVDGDRILPWSAFVKVLQAWRHWPMLDVLAPAVRERAPTDTAWRYEADLYASNPRHALPDGLRLPRLYRFQDLGDDRIALWMEDVVTTTAPWDLDRFRRAALLLGRLAARSSRVGMLPARDSQLPMSWMRFYTRSRLEPVALPALERDELWSDPLVAAVADDHLRSDLKELARRLPWLLDAIDGLPQVPTHGDACPQNLLVAEDDPDGFVVIDWAMANLGAVGFDLGQLLVGLANEGAVGVGELPKIRAAILRAYIQGLADEGMPVGTDDVRLGFDAGLVVRSAFTALPLENVGLPPNDDAHRLMAGRIELTRYLVDLGLALLPAS